MNGIIRKKFQEVFAAVIVNSLFISLIVFTPLLAPAQNIPYQDINRIQELLMTASVSSNDRKAEIFRETADMARPFGKGDSDLETVANLFGLEADRIKLFGEQFIENRKKAIDGEAGIDRAAALRNMRTTILNNASGLMEIISKDGITADEARRLVSISKVAVQAVDDLRDSRGFGEKGSFDGAKSGLQKFLSVANGILDLNKGVRDKDANALMSGFRDTIGLIERKMKALGISTINPMAVFEYPGALAGAQIQVVNEAFEQAAESLELIGQLLENDNPETRRRLSQVLERIEETLSPENFARVILNAALERTAQRFPFVRTFQSFINPVTSGVCEFRKVAEQHKLGRFYPTATISCVVEDALGKELAGTNYDEVTPISAHPATIEQRKTSRLLNSCGEIFAGTWNFSFTRNQRFGFYPAINCGNLSLEPYFHYELIVKGSRYGRLILKKGPWENASFNLPFDLIDSSGNTIALIITDGDRIETYFDVAPGTYTVKYDRSHSSYHNRRLGEEIQEAEFRNVKISAGRVTTLELPVIKQLY